MRSTAAKTESTAGIAPKASSSELERSYHLLRISCWGVALTLGALDAWAARFTMFPDGVAYLDVGDAFWRGDWHNAISAYWSPLYPWTLGFFLKIFKPSSYWEYPLVHLVNFLFYVAALACFEFFLREFIEHTRPGIADVDREIALPEWAWYVAGYSAFVVSALFLITVRFPSGDMAVEGVIFVASALILKIRGGKATSRMFTVLGLVLGIGYLAKAVMFLMSAPFLVVAAAANWRVTGDPKSALRMAGISALFFAFAASPFVLSLSREKGRPTFGDSGKINYAMSVNKVQFFIPEGTSAKHPVRRLAALPRAFEYATPVGGTYPLWFDPSYWHEGIEPHFSLAQQLRMLGLSALTCAWISFNIFLGLVMSTAIFVLYLVAPGIWRCLILARQRWELWIPAVAGIGLYFLVVIEPRYVAALFCLLWLVGLSGVRLPAGTSSRRLIAGIVIALAGTTSLISLWQSSRAARGVEMGEKHIATPICWRLADALRSFGLQPGDKIAVVATWLVPDQEASYVARLARVRIVAEARPEEFWGADDSTRLKFASEVAQAGAGAILAYQPPRSPPGWERLAGSDYYVFRTRPPANGPATVQSK